MKVELMRMRKGRLAFLAAAALAVGTILLATIEVFAIAAIRALIKLNAVVPNATQAQHMSPETLSKLSIDTVDMQRIALDPTGASGGTSIVALGLVALGGLFVVREYRYGSMAATLIAQPRRQRLLADKVAAVALTALLISAGIAFVRFLILRCGLAAQHASLHLTGLQVLALQFRGIAALTLCGCLGAGLGFLVRRQAPLLVGLGVLVGVESTMQALGNVAGVPQAFHLLPLASAAHSVELGATGWVALAASGTWALVSVLTAAYSFTREELSFVPA
ncbi:hypothetical protein [Luteococcus sp.]|uniref:hypothetical protein n=1 Tax=Luteococcus sp. TaxID=1969402 RepID=UPI0037367E0C